MWIPLLALIYEKEEKNPTSQAEHTQEKSTQDWQWQCKSGTEPKGLPRGLEKTLLRPMSGPC